MVVKILVLGDTHLRYFKDLPKDILKLLKLADWILHIGDFISKEILDGFIKLKEDRFIGVYGNADPLMVRKELSAMKIIQIEGHKFGMIHPASGGPLEMTEKRVLSEFKRDSIDVLIYGHTHEPKIEKRQELLLINPGKGYLEKNDYGPSPTIIMLTIDKEISGKIIEIKK